MRRLFNWQVLLGLFLIALSAALYLIHYAIFRDSHHIFIYLLGDIAFVPVEVLLVTLIIHRLLAIREKQAMLKKLNMVIGAFFSEVGTEFLRLFSAFDPHFDRIGKDLMITDTWSAQEFHSVRACIKSYDCAINSTAGDLQGLKDFLIGKRNFLVGLLQNPNLLEHESFTDLLWAVFHLTEELTFRVDVKNLNRERLQSSLRRYKKGISPCDIGMAHIYEPPEERISLPLLTGCQNKSIYP